MIHQIRSISIMQTTIAMYILSVFIVCQAEDFLKCSAIAAQNKKSEEEFNRVDQDTAETNFYSPIDDGYPYGANPNIEQQPAQFLPQLENGPYSGNENQQFNFNPEYDYGYSVDDPTTGDRKSHREFRRDNVVHGTYSLIEPDGSRRTVVYTADDIHGFNAVVYKDPPAPVHEGFYYDQEHAASGDPVRGNLHRTPETLESPLYGSKPEVSSVPASTFIGSSGYVPNTENAAVYGSNFLKSIGPNIPISNFLDSAGLASDLRSAPILVPNAPVDEEINNEPNFVNRPQSSENFLSKLPKIIPSVSPAEPSLPTVTVTSVTSSLSPFSTTSRPHIPNITPHIVVSTPRPSDEKVVTNTPSAVESPNHNAVTTQVPILDNVSPSSGLNPLNDGEFPLLAHISPSYAKRYARYFLR